MRFIKIALILGCFGLLTACSDSGGGSSSGGSGSATCSDISGGYHGTFVDNCAGYNATGQLLLSLKSDCSFSGTSNYGVGNSGVLSSRNGSTLVGYGTTSGNGCGDFSINCNQSGNTLDCGYSYISGGGGSMNGTLQ